MTETPNQPSRVWVWLQAARPKTLWAAVSSVLVGTSLAWRDGGFHLWAALGAVAGAVLLQIAANFANDLFDFERGADTHERLGPLRVTQAGFVTPGGMRRALFTVIGAAMMIGLLLIWRGGWPILAIGVLGIVAAILYTGGPYPYGYHGLGEVFVFIFFGLAAVIGTYYVQTLTITMTAVLLSIPMGLLAVAILVVNNLRDIDTDRRSGKRTLAVLLGREGTRIEYATVVIVSALVPVIILGVGLSSAGVLLASACLLPAWRLIRMVFTTTDGPTMNTILARTAQLQIVFGILLAIGLNL
ncbi:MAG: 1,4-dihydroxy-2-naphthoate polyprenyltransferase [Candidatus Zixiibacteriota bacterium]